MKFLLACKKRLSIQLGLLILATNILFLSICFIFLYKVIGNVLQTNYEESMVKRFEQAEYNINSFCDQIDLISMRLSTDGNLNLVAENVFGSTKKRTIYLQNSIENMMKEINNYSYINSIILFGEGGSVLKCDNVGSIKMNYYYDKGDIDDRYYSSEIYNQVKGSKQRLNWFGGYTINDFGFEGSGMDGKEYCIIAARNLSNGTGQIVIDISLEYFQGLFNANKEELSENTYILDENDQIIVSKYYEMIGQKREIVNGETAQAGIERCVEAAEQGEIQVLKYELPFLGWYLVSETPMKEVIKEIVFLKNTLLLSCLFSTVVSFLFSLRWIVGLIRPLEKLTSAAQKIGAGELGYTLNSVPKNEIGVLTESFNRMSKEVQKLFIKNKQIEEEKRNYEMESLRAQINPHFIYNTLNTIKWMAIVNHENGIAESITLLSEFMEPIFKKSGSMCTIREELEYIEKYVAIMNLRTVGGYSLIIDVSEEFLNYKVIRFLLQPIVENAILHGMKECACGEIRISMWVEGQDGFLRIEDNGSGIEEPVLQKLIGRLEQEEVSWTGENIGIVNVCRRIRNQYGEDYGLTICNGEQQGTVVTLKIRLEFE